ncbi:hypothetical protein [Vibrio sp. 10N]|uniref:hypothetical protein n=1 Tax=Vibrio sp. 10N TaxID=3058938 RepID=UPI002813A5C0|nr:hypothetical protein VB10N_40130 [Vibrio sp. 10N]
MIKTHHNFLLSGSPQRHAHVHVNPVGEVDVDIVELDEHHNTEFTALKFQRSQHSTLLKGMEISDHKSWQISLNNRDADELNKIIERANEDFEQLMRDL